MSDIKFFAREEESNKKVLVEYTKDESCSVCKLKGCYWIGGDCKICQKCVFELVKFFRKLSKTG